MTPMSEDPSHPAILFTDQDKHRLTHRNYLDPIVAPEDSMPWRLWPPTKDMRCRCTGERWFSLGMSYRNDEDEIFIFPFFASTCMVGLISIDWSRLIFLRVQVDDISLRPFGTFSFLVLWFWLVREVGKFSRKRA